MAKGKKTGGRQKGTPNKVSSTVKQNVIEVFDTLGGVGAMAKWAENNQTEFYRLYARCLPHEIGAESDTDQISVQIVRFSDLEPDAN